MEDLRFTCACGLDAGPIIRSERHVVEGRYVHILRQRRCAAGHITMTRAREYEEVFEPDVVIASLVPVEGEALAS